MEAAGWHKIGDRVWVRRYEFADESVGLISGKRGLVVVDTRATHDDADRLLANIRALSPSEPIVAAVNTHGHWDHAFGNARFTDVPIWGHADCPAFMAATAENMRALLLTTGLTGEARRAIQRVEVTAPNTLFQTSATIELGDRQILLEHLGRGHTDSDVVVRVPDAAVIFAGDLVKESGPPGYRDAFPAAWVRTAKMLLDRVDGIVVPGHGAPVDRSFITRWVATLQRTAELASAVTNNRITTDEALARSIVHPRAMRQAIERAYLEPGVRAAE